MITSGQEECQCLATCQHARAVHVNLLLPMHYVAKNELNLSYPLVPPNFQNVVGVWCVQRDDRSESRGRTTPSRVVSEDDDDDDDDEVVFTKSKPRTTAKKFF